MKILKYILIFLSAIVVLFGVFLLYAVLTDYKPKEKQIIFENENTTAFNKNSFSVIIWNIGYCGMDKTMDFFYDGGKQTRVSKKQTLINIAAIKKFFKKYKGKTDFFLLQEVDKKAKRSYKTNQQDTISKILNDYNSYFAYNYKVAFVPIPFLKPYGKVQAGLATYSKHKPLKVVRFQYPGNFSFPTNLFMLDRCFIESRYKLNNGKELLMINLHNSAFDDGSLKAQQLNYLKKYIKNEYKKGNYLIIGGDWNQSPPYFEPNYHDYINDTLSNSYIPADFFGDNFVFVYDNTSPTNRRSFEAYNKLKTPVTVIDFYMISDNIKIENIETINLNFENSDHNPVWAEFKLLK